MATVIGWMGSFRDLESEPLRMPNASNLRDCVSYPSPTAPASECTVGSGQRAQRSEADATATQRGHGRRRRLVLLAGCGLKQLRSTVLALVVVWRNMSVQIQGYF